MADSLSLTSDQLVPDDIWDQFQSFFSPSSPGWERQQTNEVLHSVVDHQDSSFPYPSTAWTRATFSDIQDFDWCLALEFFKNLRFRMVATHRNMSGATVGAFETIISDPDRNLDACHVEIKTPMVISNRDLVVGRRWEYLRRDESTSDPIGFVGVEYTFDPTGDVVPLFPSTVRAVTHSIVRIEETPVGSSSYTCTFATHMNMGGWIPSFVTRKMLEGRGERLLGEFQEGMELLREELE